MTSAYDPMLAKVAAWGPDRATALRRLDAALAQTAVLGVTTNIAFLIYSQALIQFDVGNASAGGLVAVVIANIVAFFLVRIVGRNLEA